MFCLMVGPFLLVLFCPKRILRSPFAELSSSFWGKLKVLKLKMQSFFDAPLKIINTNGVCNAKTTGPTSNKLIKDRNNLQ